MSERTTVKSESGEEIDIEKVLDKIKKILAKAGDNPSEEEAKVCTEMAQSVLLKYNLELSQVFAHQSAEEREVATTSMMATHENRIADWKWMLLKEIGEVNFCKIYQNKNVFVKGCDKPQHTLHLIGRPHNIRASVEMYVYLSIAIHNLCYRHLDERKAAGIHEKEGARVYAESWRQGCVRRVGERLREKMKAAQSDGAEGSTALVVRSLYEKELKANDEFGVKLGLRAGTAPKRKFDQQAFNSGYKAGASVSLNSQIGRSGKTGAAQVGPAPRQLSGSAGR